MVMSNPYGPREALHRRLCEQLENPEAGKIRSVDVPHDRLERRDSHDGTGASHKDESIDFTATRLGEGVREVFAQRDVQQAQPRH